MATGALDANGVYIYGEDDPASPVSDLLNLGMDSVSDAVGDAKARLTTLEAPDPVTAWVASSGAPSAAIGATHTQVLAAPAVIGNGAKKFKITFTYYSMVSTVAGDTFNVYIGRTGLPDIGGIMTSPLLTTTTGGNTVSVYDTPPPGSTVYSAGIGRSTGTGNATIYAGGGAPMQIIVEQIT